MRSDREELEAALRVAERPFDLKADEEALLDDWCQLRRGISALGGWFVRRGLNDANNPAVFETEDGQRIRRRIVKIEERLVHVRCAGRPSHCSVCGKPYEYALLRLYHNESDPCSGCETPCPYCGGLHRQSHVGGQGECIKSFRARLEKLEAGR